MVYHGMCLAGYGLEGGVYAMARVLLMGMEEFAARRIEAILSRAGHEVIREHFRTSFPAAPPADVIFLWGDHRDYGKTLSAIRTLGETPPVIVTTKLPDTCAWIDNCEPGVAGYCVAPFDTAHVLWTINAALAQKAPMEKAMVA